MGGGDREEVYFYLLVFEVSEIRVILDSAHAQSPHLIVFFWKNVCFQLIIRTKTML